LHTSDTAISPFIAWLLSLVEIAVHCDCFVLLCQLQVHLLTDLLLVQHSSSAHVQKRCRVVSVRSANLDSVRQLQVERSGEYREQITELSAQCATHEQQVETERQRLIDYKKDFALAAINSRSGRPIPPQVSLNQPCRSLNSQDLKRWLISWINSSNYNSCYSSLVDGNCSCLHWKSVANNLANRRRNLMNVYARQLYRQVLPSTY